LSVRRLLTLTLLALIHLRDNLFAIQFFVGLKVKTGINVKAADGMYRRPSR
jgi:hypothetical protein